MSAAASRIWNAAALPMPKTKMPTRNSGNEDHTADSPIAAAPTSPVAMPASRPPRRP